MLSIESFYPPAHQLALDMLKRLSTANEEIVEVLLSKHHLIPALRLRVSLSFHPFNMVTKGLQIQSMKIVLSVHHAECIFYLLPVRTSPQSEQIAELSLMHVLLKNHLGQLFGSLS